MLDRLKRFLDPRNPGGLDVGHYALMLIAVLIVGISVGVGGTKTVENLQGSSAPTILKQPKPDQLRVLKRFSSAEVAGCYIPPSYLFRLSGVWAVLHGYYDDESGILGSTPCQDSDFMVPAGSHEHLTLPGSSAVRYTFLWTGYVNGSGYYMTFEAPNGGRFAYLHVMNPYPFAWGATLRGGTYVGLQSWPFSYTYSNGYCNDWNACSSDAHLCLVTDWGGANWFYTLVTNPPREVKPPKRARFLAGVYEQYRKAHHKPLIPYKSHGKLTHGALLWSRHHPRQFGGILRPEQWTPHGTHGVDGVEQDSYQGGDIYWWPKHPHWKPHIVKHRWIR